MPVEFAVDLPDAAVVKAEVPESGPGGKIKLERVLRQLVVFECEDAAVLRDVNALARHVEVRLAVRNVRAVTRDPLACLLRSLPPRPQPGA
jgi:hypothetical protein